MRITMKFGFMGSEPESRGVRTRQTSMGRRERAGASRTSALGCME